MQEQLKLYFSFFKNFQILNHLLYSSFSFFFFFVFSFSSFDLSFLWAQDSSIEDASTSHITASSEESSNLADSSNLFDLSHIPLMMSSSSFPLFSSIPSSALKGEKDLYLEISYFSLKEVLSYRRDDFFRAILFFWSDVLEHEGESLRKDIFSEGDFQGSLLFDQNGSSYLQILDLKTSQVFYQSFDEKFKKNGHVKILKNFFLHIDLKTFEEKVKKDLNYDLSQNLNQDAFSLLKAASKTLSRQTRLFKKELKLAQNELKDVFLAAQLLNEKLDEVRESNRELSWEEFERSLIRPGFVHLETAFALSEYNMLENKMFMRIVHKDTEKVFLLYLKRDLPLNEELKKDYIRKQINLSGTARKDKHFGRDGFVIVLDLEDFHSISFEDLLNSEDFSYFLRHEIALDGKNFTALFTHPSEYGPSLLSFMKDYITSIYTRPNLSTASLGIVMGLGQTATIVGLLSLFSAIAKEHSGFLETKSLSDFNVLLSTVILPMIWGTPVAIFSRTYKNFITHGTLLSRWMKNTFVSASSYIVFSMALNHSYNFLDLEFISSMSLVIVMQNLMRTLLQEIPKMRERAYLNKDTINLIDGKIQWERSDLEIQLSYSLPSILKQFDILGISFMGLPLGKTLLTLGFPIGLWLTKYVAEKMDEKYPHNGKIEEDLAKTQKRWKLFKFAFTHPILLYLTLKKEFYFFFKGLLLNQDFVLEKDLIDKDIAQKIKAFDQNAVSGTDCSSWIKKIFMRKF